MDKRNDWFVNYHASEGRAGLRRLESRTQYFNQGDFMCADILDIGCNSGQMSKYALDQGAKYVLGVDYDQSAIKLARELKETYTDKVDFISDDIDNYLFYANLPSFDTILFLSVIGTEELKDPRGILARLSDKCKVMYLEGHHNTDYNELMEMITTYTCFRTIEYAGKTYDNPEDTVGRHFFRLSKSPIEHDNVANMIYKELSTTMDCNPAKPIKIAVMGFGGVGKSHIRERLVETLERGGQAVYCTFRNRNNNNAVAFAGQNELGHSYVILDDVFFNNRANNSIVLFDYQAQKIMGNPDIIFYIGYDTATRFANRGVVGDIDCTLHRTPELLDFSFKKLYYVNGF